MSDDIETDDIFMVITDDRLTDGLYMFLNLFVGHWEMAAEAVATNEGAVSILIGTIYKVQAKPLRGGRCAALASLNPEIAFGQIHVPECKTTRHFIAHAMENDDAFTLINDCVLTRTGQHPSLPVPVEIPDDMVDTGIIRRGFAPGSHLN